VGEGSSVGEGSPVGEGSTVGEGSVPPPPEPPSPASPLPSLPSDSPPDPAAAPPSGGPPPGSAAGWTPPSLPIEATSRTRTGCPMSLTPAKARSGTGSDPNSSAESRGRPESSRRTPTASFTPSRAKGHTAVPASATATRATAGSPAISICRLVRRSTARTTAYITTPPIVTIRAKEIASARMLRSVFVMEAVVGA
jgi:hypothetical protein